MLSKLRISHPKEYREWVTIRHCGAEICSTWRELHSFPQFLTDVGVCPATSWKLIRIDKNSPYSPDNVKWASRHEQAKQRRNARLITYKGTTQTMNQWAKELGITSSMIWYRLANGCSIEEVLTATNYKKVDPLRSQYPREYVIWNDMKSRCSNKNSSNYNRYGSKGIKVCDAWNAVHAFPKFLDDMGPCPDPNWSIDRIDTNGDYTPENCRWVSPETQATNKRTNIYISYNGKTQTISEWSNAIGIAPSTIRYRIRLGLPLEEILSSTLRRRGPKPR